jgi:catechol 2,3-dioxygenase-like lactoylglutathione lyase family enzyme
MTIRESNVTVMVQDMDRAIAFYESIGLVLKQRWENHYAQMETVDIIIGLHPADDGSAAPSAQVSIGFIIDDIEAGTSLLEGLGVPFTFSDGKSGLYLHFNDPDGTFLYFTQPKWSR